MNKLQNISHHHLFKSLGCNNSTYNIQGDRRESNGFKKKSTRYIFNLKWMYFYKIKGQDMPFE